MAKMCTASAGGRPSGRPFLIQQLLRDLSMAQMFYAQIRLTVKVPAASQGEAKKRIAATYGDNVEYIRGPVSERASGSKPPSWYKP